MNINNVHVSIVHIVDYIMPNYCYNVLQVECMNNPEILDQFYYDNKMEVEVECQSDPDFKKESELTFEKAIPTKEYSVEWHNTFWGTKWDAINVECIKEKEEMTYYFETAWSPPCAWLEVVASKYSGLQFTLEYSESGMDFCGKQKYENGKRTFDASMELSKYNWEKVNKNMMLDIVKKYSEQIITEDNIDEMTEQIMEEYGDLDTYYDNIECYIQGLLKTKNQ